MTQDLAVASMQYSMSYGFLQQSRSHKVDELLAAAPMAFLLITQIARRARRDASSLNVHDLALSEALVGDYKAIGMSERQYRTAKMQLEKWGLATFKATNKGTVATLTDDSVYNINAGASDGPEDRRATGKRRTGDRQATTKNNGKNEKEGKEDGDADASATNTFVKPSREEFDAEVISHLGMEQNDADYVWNVWEENGWTRQEGGKRIKITNWRLALNKWKSGLYFPSQKHGTRNERVNGHGPTRFDAMGRAIYD